jgi:hypothetical protein
MANSCCLTVTIPRETGAGFYPVGKARPCR